MSLLRIQNVAKHFGGVRAVDGISFDVAENSIVGLIGPNGAGKTALINLISGFYFDATGSIMLEGHELLNQPIHRIARLGVARTFQNIKLFRRMSVVENVMTAAPRAVTRPLRSYFDLNHRAATAEALALLDLVGLTDKADDLASSLAYGDARRLEIARALASRPKLLVMDEPAAGMNETESEGMVDLIRLCQARVSSVLLIEHDIAMVRALCGSVVAMNNGAKIAEGTPEAVLSDPVVRVAYIGEDE